MQDISTHISIALPGLLEEAWIDIERAGQQHPGEGDGVKVKYILRLPREEGRNLHPGLQFDNRHSLFGESLSAVWGISDDNMPFRYKKGTCTAGTWRKAFADAEAICRKALDKLIRALERRQAALLAADIDESVWEED